MAVNANLWRKSFKTTPLQPVYFFAGEELLVLEALQDVRARAQQQGYQERDVLHVDGRFNWDQLAQAGAGMSLFASKRIIDVRMPKGRPGTEGSKAIKAWCAHPPQDTLLLVSAFAWSKSQSGVWTRALEKTGDMVVFYPPRDHEWPRWVGARMASRGLSANREACEWLAARVEGNLLAAAQEIDKLAAIVTEQPITVELLENMVADSSHYDVFKLVDAALSGQSARTIRILHGLWNEGEDVLPLMAWVVNQLQLLIRLANASDFAAQVKAEHLWSKRTDVLKRALRRAPGAYWEACLRRAALIDQVAKGQAAGDSKRLFERLLIMIADPHTAKVLA